MIFPKLQDKNCGYVNLNIAAEDWLRQKSIDIRHGDPNLLNDPAVCADMVTALHKRLDIVFSYGGWLEDRSVIWHGSYLEREGTFLHLGQDINAPAGTEVAIDFDATVVRIDDDNPEIGGWGPRVIVRHDKEGVHVLYAHLDRDIGVVVGDRLVKDQVFAKVGHAPFNGNWYPHVHVQILTPTAYEATVRDGFSTLDGYGRITDISQLAKDFPDPLRYIRI